MNRLVYGSYGSGSPRMRSMPNIHCDLSAVAPGTAAGSQATRPTSASSSIGTARCRNRYKPPPSPSLLFVLTNAPQSSFRKTPERRC